MDVRAAVVREDFLSPRRWRCRSVNVNAHIPINTCIMNPPYRWTRNADRRRGSGRLPVTPTLALPVGQRQRAHTDQHLHHEPAVPVDAQRRPIDANDPTRGGGNERKPVLGILRNRMAEPSSRRTDLHPYLAEPPNPLRGTERGPGDRVLARSRHEAHPNDVHSRSSPTETTSGKRRGDGEPREIGSGSDLETTANRRDS